MTDQIDEKDKRILDVLQDHAEYATRQIAKKTLLPVTTVHHRIKKLRAEGVIKKYTVELEPAKIGKNFVAYVLISANLSMLKQKKKTQDDLAKELRKLYFIERVDIVSGVIDLVAIVRVKDVEEFNTVLLKKVQLMEGVEKTQSLIVIHEG